VLPENPDHLFSVAGRLRNAKCHQGLCRTRNCGHGGKRWESRPLW
jgi:hypothetical protein